MNATETVTVDLADRRYDIIVGEDVFARAGELMAPVLRQKRVVVITDENVGGLHLDTLAVSLEKAGIAHSAIVLPPGEQTKDFNHLEGLMNRLLDAGIERRTTLVALGGGVVGDITGFAAAIALRGLDFVQIPTTLLAQVDSSVGGKTGFNRARGKNLVGTFYQPKFVLCDVQTLSTLPSEERVAGLAEVVKSAWLDSEESVAMLEGDAGALLAGDDEATIRAVRMSIQLKSRIVHEDERESGRRMLLNLGHTVGHGLEAAGDYRAIRHGEGVALGMIAAMRVATRLGRGRPQETQRLIRLLERLGLPTDLDRRLNRRVLDFIGSDKKRRGDRIHFVIPRLPGQTEVELLGLDELRGALEAC